VCVWIVCLRCIVERRCSVEGLLMGVVLLWLGMMLVGGVDGVV
jgi:hypothetical protein